MVTGKPIVAYYRVSTDRQGQSGLGLEGQEQALQAFARQSGGKILKSFKEVESGKRKDRPELAKALAHAKRSGAVLAIAKLDRLARNVHFVSGLMESGVDFVACDNPTANKLTVHILSAIGEHEAEQISQRTKAALAAYKARGGKLGASLPQCRNLDREARLKGSKATKAIATEAYADLAPMILEWSKEGMTQRAIADRLNSEGHVTRTGKPWSNVQVMRVIKRFKAKQAF